MQIKLVVDNIEEEEQILRELNVVSLDSALICLKPSSSISLWIIDYYFTKIYSDQIKISNKSIQPKNIIGSHDMFIIYQLVQSSSSSIEFVELCQNKLKQMKNDFILDNYNNYLNRCGLVDIIDLFHQCQLESFVNTIILSIDNIKNDIDRLFFDYLLELSSSSCIYNVKTKITTTETRQNLLELIDNEKKYDEQTISKISIKHTLCTYLSLLLDTRNEHALIHCLVTPARNGIERATIVELKRLAKLSKNECLTIYQILLSFIRRKELILNRISSSQQDQTNTADESFHILDKYYIGIKELFDFIEQLQMIIEENEHFKFESIATFRKLLELISKQLRKDISFNRSDLIIKEIIEEFCQCFETTLPLMNCSSPIRSASSGASLAGPRFLRSMAYLSAKQAIDLPIVVANNGHYDSPSIGLRKATYSRLLQSSLAPSPSIIDQASEIPVEEKAIDLPKESVFVWQSKTNDQTEESSNQNRYRRCKSHRCLDLSTIHETSFDAGSIVDNATNHLITCNDKIPSQSTAKRQPLRQIDVNSFINEEREIENEKNSFVFSLVSDGDKENLPVTTKKRSMMSTNVEPPCKKQKKTGVTGQKMITSFFQSTS